MQNICNICKNICRIYAKIYAEYMQNICRIYAIYAIIYAIYARVQKPEYMQNICKNICNICIICKLFKYMQYMHSRGCWCPESKLESDFTRRRNGPGFIIRIPKRALEKLELDTGMPVLPGLPGPGNRDGPRGLTVTRWALSSDSGGELTGSSPGQT